MQTITKGTAMVERHADAAVNAANASTLPVARSACVASDPRTVRSPGLTLADFLLGEERALRLQLERAELEAAKVG